MKSADERDASATAAATVAEEDAANDHDTLGLRWSDEPRRGGAGAHDITSVAVSTLTTPTMEPPPPLPTAAVPLSSSGASGTIALTAAKTTEKASDGCDDEEHTDVTTEPLTSTLANTSKPQPRSSDTTTITEEALSDDGDHTEDEADTLEMSSEAESVVSATDALTLLPRPQQQQITATGASASPLGPEADPILPHYAPTQRAQQPGNAHQEPIAHIPVDVPIATLVEEEERGEDEEVIMGTPLELPEPPVSWWKQKKARVTLALFCVALFVMSVALWIALSSDVENIIVLAPQSSPPSLVVSPAPSSSLSPSSPPSIAHLEGLFEYSCDCYPQVAMDGDTAVVARKYDIHFFSTANSRFDIVTKIDIDYWPTAATIQNGTAVIGAYRDGAVYVYERNRQGVWSQALLLQPRDLCGPQPGCQGAWFGRGIALDDDVLIVGAPRDRGAHRGSAHVYRRHARTWTKEATLAPHDAADAQYFGQSVSVKGTSIVVGDPGEWMGRDNEGAVYVYRFEASSRSWRAAEGTLVNYVCDDWNYFVGLTDGEELLVLCGEFRAGTSTVYYYARPRAGEDYALVQEIEFDNGIESLALERETLVVVEVRVGTTGAIHARVRRDGRWEEVATLEESFFDAAFGDNVAVAGNITLVASTANVYELALL